MCNKYHSVQSLMLKKVEIRPALLYSLPHKLYTPLIKLANGCPCFCVFPKRSGKP